MAGELANQQTYNGGTAQVPVDVPVDRDMATEPAMTLADAQKVANAVVLLVGFAGIKLSPELTGALGDIVPYLFGAGMVVYGVWTAHHQGVLTRDAVYAPATVATKVTEAKEVATATAATTPATPPTASTTPGGFPT